MLCHQTLADDLMDPGLIISQLKSMYHDFSWKFMVKKKKHRNEYNFMSHSGKSLV